MFPENYFFEITKFLPLFFSNDRKHSLYAYAKYCFLADFVFDIIVFQIQRILYLGGLCDFQPSYDSCIICFVSFLSLAIFSAMKLQ